MKNVMAKVAKINKEELSAQKVELASSAELDNYVKVVEGAIKKIDSNYDKLNGVVRDIKSKKAELFKQVNTGDNNKKVGDIVKQNGTALLKELKRQADDLGVDVDDIRNYRKLRELIDEAVGKSENLWFLVNNSKSLVSALSKL
jgi:arginyl-tRNA synthetase